MKRNRITKLCWIYRLQFFIRGTDIYVRVKITDEGRERVDGGEEQKNLF